MEDLPAVAVADLPLGDEKTGGISGPAFHIAAKSQLKPVITQWIDMQFAGNVSVHQRFGKFYGVGIGNL